MCLAELERVEVGDRGKQDEYRRGLTFDDDTYHTPDPLRVWKDWSVCSLCCTW